MVYLSVVLGIMYLCSGLDGGCSLVYKCNSLASYLSLNSEGKKDTRSIFLFCFVGKWLRKVVWLTPCLNMYCKALDIA